MQHIRTIIVAILFLFSSFMYAVNFPVYSPGGSVSPIALSDVLSPMPQLAGPGWWYFVSLLHDQDNASHSLQVTLIRATWNETMYGIGGIGFTFTDSHGKTQYLWNLYLNPTMMIYYPIAPLKSAMVSQPNFILKIHAAHNAFSPGFSYVFSLDPRNHLLVGQIGAVYHLTARGVGEIGVAQNTPQYVNYKLEMTVQDQRGLVPEGYNGFVGIPFLTDPAVIQTWEMAMPNLRVQKWKMTISPIGKTTTSSPVSNTLQFRGKIPTEDRLWLDRQVENHGVQLNLFQRVLQQKLNHDALAIFDNSEMKPLYHGTWMAFCFDQQPFKNVCGESVAMWQPGTPTEQMDSDQNATSGFMNVFTPDSNAQNSLRVGNTLTEVLSFAPAQKNLPYRIQNDVSGIVQSPITQNRYDKIVYVTVRENTLFSAMLDQLSGKLNNDRDYIFKFQVLSGKTENVTFSNNYGYYEGAATVSLCTPDKQSCRPIGTGFMEQMGYFTV